MRMLQLPDDLITLLVTFLTNKDKKALRLVNRRLSAFTPLPLNRVFISPSYKNIEVFRAVAAHPIISMQVKEIIWDDARFEKFDPDDDDQSELLPDERVKNKHDFREEVERNIKRFGKSHESFVQAKRSGFDFEARRPLSIGPVPEDLFMSLEENWDLYNRLYDEQETIIRERLDIAAFRDGLVAFPHLERITVTSEAYRPTIVNPYYPTPLIRSLPFGFNYPAPWPWMPEPEDEGNVELTLEEVRRYWRGIVLTLVALAQSERLVPEYIIDTRYEHLGVPYRLFDQPCEELDSLRNLCERGLQRLDLAIHAFPLLQNPGLTQLPRGHLKDVLRKAKYLEHFSLHMATGEHPEDSSPRELNENMDTLSTIPLESWPLLRHITLSSIPVIYSDLIEFCRRLPPTVKSVELIDVGFTEGTYRDFLEVCRDDLLWKSNKPVLAIAHQGGPANFPWRKKCVQEDIARFFEGQHNPFEGMHSGRQIQFGFGIAWDPLDVDFFEPNIPDLETYVCVSPGVYRMRTKEDGAN